MSVHSSSESGLIVTSVCKLVREIGLASLATHDAETGHPYASLVTVATETDGTPITLISNLSVHTQNLKQDPRASILFAPPSGDGDPLDSGRVSVMGTTERTSDPLVRQRFLAKHPEASLYADFGDFSFCRMPVLKAHYVGGFGRVATLSPDKFMLDEAAASIWDERIGAVIEALNATEHALISRIAHHSGGEQGGGWHIAACDPDGCDLVLETASIRVPFAHRLSSPDMVADALSAAITR